MKSFKHPLLPDRFWSKVLPIENGCWIWIGAISGTGYGSFGLETGKGQSAHRIAYMFLVGPVRKGLDLDHLCRNRDCVNPAHLEPVTRLENVRRGDAGKHWSSRTNCPKGHPYDDKNTRWRTDRLNSRDCRACKNALMRVKRFFASEAKPLKPLTVEQVVEINRLMESA